MTDRRAFLTLAAGLALPGAALAQGAADTPPAQPEPPQAAPEPRPEPPPVDQRLTERSVGRADAPVTVIEYFSLTCGHCAAFHRDTWPRVKRDLVDTGRVRMIWRDFPLDQTALMAAMVARALPPERYEGFVSTLFQTQDRWAFARNSDPRTELARVAALAGMPREAFDAAVTDQALGRGILEARLRGQQEFNVNSTPTFVFGSRVVPGNIAFDRFAALVAETR